MIIVRVYFIISETKVEELLYASEIGPMAVVKKVERFHLPPPCPVFHEHTISIPNVIPTMNEIYDSSEHERQVQFIYMSTSVLIE